MGDSGGSQYRLPGAGPSGLRSHGELALPFEDVVELVFVLMGVDPLFHPR